MTNRYPTLVFWVAYAFLGVIRSDCFAADALAQGERFRESVLTILEDRCYDCHGDGANKGSLALDQFESDADLIGQVDLWEKVAKIDLYYVTHFSKFLQRLHSMKDVDGSSVLDNSMIFYGGAIANGNRHNHENLPALLAGGGGGSLNPGRFVKLSSQPMSNLFLSLADRMGVQSIERFGDSTGRIESI